MENPTFHLESIVKDKNELQDFDGPLSLILMLLQKDKIEIRDLKISEILDQYIAYLEQMESMDLEVSTEFVQMASHLLYIKTRTLLQGEEEVSELAELMSSLERLKCRDLNAAVQKIIPDLKKASELGLLYYAKRPEPLPPRSKIYEYRHEPAELLRALYAVITRGGRPAEPELAERIMPARIVYEVKAKSKELIERLRRSPARLSELYRSCRSRSELVATFISVLELCSIGSVELSGDEDDLTVGFVGGEINEILDKIAE